MHYLKGVLLHDLLHHLPAASVLLWPPFHVLVLAACQLMQTQELLEKIESNMVTEEVSFAITN